MKTLMLEELPRRIECFDISHIQGAETGRLHGVVWEDGAMKKSELSQIQVKTILAGVDDFATVCAR